MKSKLHLILPGIYVVLAVYFIVTQGLFGESFIALILGMPWVLLPSFFEFWGADGVFLGILLILPMVFNTYLFYMIGKYFGCQSKVC